MSDDIDCPLGRIFAVDDDVNVLLLDQREELIFEICFRAPRIPIVINFNM